MNRKGLRMSGVKKGWSQQQQEGHKQVWRKGKSHVMCLELTYMKRKEDIHKMSGNTEVKDYVRYKVQEFK